MPNPIKTLGRLFQRNPRNDFVGELYSKVNKPLFVHPHIGKGVIQGYMDALKITPEPKSAHGEAKSSVHVSTHDNIAVLDISGSLVDREMSVPCMKAPVSYEAIKMEMSELLADESIDTIVARLDSPGGVASQNMDLSDFIYSSRGQGTELIAMVDDMAYSAAFGIASAFDQIWLTRTGGVGSVGVVSYHEDHSEALKKAGVKVEYIYAGDKKVFGNPAEPLTDEARKDFQGEVSRLYEIFTATVARNLNMSLEDVKATQAGTFHGQAAVDAGFAHHIGTFDELMTLLMSGEPFEMVSNGTGTKMSGTELKEGEVGELSTDEVDQILHGDEYKQEKDFGIPEDQETEKDAGTEPVKDVEEDVKSESQQEQEAETVLAKYRASVEALCMTAGVSMEVAEKYIAAEMSLDDVRMTLMTLTSNENTQIASAKSVQLVKDAKEQTQQDWDDAFKQCN